MASNDYYAPRPKNPLKYFCTDHKRVHGVPLPWRDLRDGMTEPRLARPDQRRRRP